MRQQRIEEVCGRSGKPILVVEDEKWISKSLQLILSSWSWDPVPAFTLEEGRRAIRTGGFRDVILDLLLPDGDGSTLLREIQSQGLPIRVVVSSACAFHREDELLALGAGGILTKPYTMKQLQAVLGSASDD